MIDKYIGAIIAVENDARQVRRIIQHRVIIQSTRKHDTAYVDGVVFESIDSGTTRENDARASALS